MKKVSDEEIRRLYTEKLSVWQVAKAVGLCGQTVHERLQALGVEMTGGGKPWTEADEQRLAAEYAVFRTAGKLAELAEGMGRTKHFLCRQARALGLTDAKGPKEWNARWKYMTEAAAGVMLDAFKRSPLGVKRYCQRHGIPDLGFQRTMERFFPDVWTHVIESKAPLSGAYRRGRAFEYRCRDVLVDRGCYVLRSPQSRTPVDLVGLRPGAVLFVQCKVGGTFANVAEWNELIDLSDRIGAIPLLAAPNPDGPGIAWWRMTGRKDGSKRPQPMVRWEP